MNDRVDIKKIDVLSDNWYVLKKVTFDYRRSDGSWHTQEREAYDRGNGATILLYNVGHGTVVLTRQFRVPTYINGNPTGMLIEACAGLLDDDDPATCIRRETEEETGYAISGVEHVGKAYMSPGSVTEVVHFFIAEYSAEMKVHDGGGLDHEHEDIEVLEIPFDEAFAMIRRGEIQDGKTIMLLQYAHIAGLFQDAPVDRSLHVLVAGPYRSGTGDDPALIRDNVAFMNRVALQIWERGHLPVLGEWYALPLAETAGSREPGDIAFERVFRPTANRLVPHCDAVLRVGGPSAGADEMVRAGREHGKVIFHDLGELPDHGSDGTVGFD